MDKLAELTGYTSGSASVTLGRIKRKLKSFSADPALASPAKSAKSKASAAATPKSAKRGAAGTDGDESPTKKTKATPRKGSAKGKKAMDDDDEYANVKIKGEETDDLLKSAAIYYQNAGKDAFAENGEDE